ncbi:hypothetical protein OIO90_004507 [Microbotryomycetes sp. JL221]|nr:hypothetical protein OIO90_004507 [Microbotryomycetes sp. JL221]
MSDDRRPPASNAGASATGATTTHSNKPAPELVRPPTYIFYGSKSVKARISKDVPINEVIRQLVTSSQLSISEPPALFALRNKDTGDIVTDDNIEQMLEQQAQFTLCSNPTIEAAEMVDKLNTAETSVRKLATFSLRTLIKERVFLEEFVKRGGVAALQQVIQSSTGNTLAYALLSMQHLMELEDRAWQDVDSQFVARIVEIIAKETLINICKPATAILRRLASSDAPSDTVDQSASGFSRVYQEIRKRNGFLEIVVDRMAGDEVALVELSLSLINSLFEGATKSHNSEFSDDLESLGVWKAVAKLFESEREADMPLALEFQSILAQSLHQDLQQQLQDEHFAMFDVVWNASKLEDTDESNRWRRAGFNSESPQDELADSGILGLKALVRFVENPESGFSKMLEKQRLRPEGERCPLSTVSGIVTRVLAEHFGFAKPPAEPVDGENGSASEPKPLLLRFYDCHAVLLRFFVRMWIEANATHEDYQHIASIVKDQAGVSLTSDKAWSTITQEFSLARYRAIRDRQLDELARNDELMNKPSVKALRGRLYLESYEFVRNQRIQCILDGAWFPVTAQVTKLLSGKRQTTTKAWRFYRLAPNRQYLHYCEVPDRVDIRPGLADLPDKIELESVTDILPGPSTANAAKPTQRLRRHESVTSHNSTVKSAAQAATTASNQTLTFTLLGSDGPLAEFTAPSSHVYAEWIDGLSLLRTDGNICTKETADFVAALTDMGVKTRLLELQAFTGKIELPDHVETPPWPQSTAMIKRRSGAASSGLKSVSSSRQRMIWIEPEPGWFIHATIELPHSANEHARGASNGTSSSRGDASNLPTSHLMHDDLLSADLLAAYREFRLTSGSLKSLANKHERSELRLVLKSWWDEWTSRWNLASSDSGTEFIKSLNGVNRSALADTAHYHQITPLMSQSAVINSNALTILLHNGEVLHLGERQEPTIDDKRTRRPFVSDDDLVTLLRLLSRNEPRRRLLQVNHERTPKKQDSAVASTPAFPSTTTAATNKWSYATFLTTPTLPSMPVMPSMPSIPSVAMPSIAMPSLSSLPGMSSTPPTSSGSPIKLSTPSSTTSGWSLRKSSWNLLSGHRRTESKAESEASSIAEPTVSGVTNTSIVSETTTTANLNSRMELEGTTSPAVNTSRVPTPLPATPQVELAPEVDSSALAEAMGNFASGGTTPATEALREIGTGQEVTVKDKLELREGGEDRPEVSKIEHAEQSGTDPSEVGTESEVECANDEVLRVYLGESDDDEAVEVRKHDRGPLTLIVINNVSTDPDKVQWLQSRAERLLEAAETILEPVLPPMLLYSHRFARKKGPLLSLGHWPLQIESWSGKEDSDEQDVTQVLIESNKRINDEPRVLETFVRLGNSQWILSRRTEDVVDFDEPRSVTNAELDKDMSQVGVRMNQQATVKTSVTDVFVVLPPKVGKDGSLVDAAEELRKFDQAYQ